MFSYLLLTNENNPIPSIRIAKLDNIDAIGSLITRSLIDRRNEIL